MVEEIRIGQNRLNLHVHRWKPIPGLEKFPQRLCKCGAIKARTLNVGERSISLSPAGVGDVARWSASGTPLALGDLGMDVATGLPRAFADGISSPLGLQGDTAFGQRRLWVIQQNGGLTTLDQYGFGTAPTQNGTATVHDSGLAQFVEYTTAAGPNTDAGWLSTAFTETRRDYIPIHEIMMRTGGSVASVRFWIGLFQSTPMASATPAIHYAGFRYDTGVDGTAFWRCVTDSASGVPTVTTTAVAMTANTAYRLKLILTSANVRFYINDVLVATHTTTLPANGVALGHVEQCRVLVAATQVIRLSRISLSQVAAA